ncbi:MULTISPECIES: carbohydrate ABC transporter permease [unclassified Paenibacillus]|uniref:carbohydrate ABC transporter permease n=1 Tax=unclassified Paenibacillus TaxID=185978 RepID=UPI0036429F90
MLYKSWGSKVFDYANYVALFLVALCTIIPFLYILSVSFATSQEVLTKKFILFPETFTLDAYIYIFSTGTVARSMLVTIFITVVGTLLNLLLTCLTAYPLARKELMGRRTMLLLVTFTLLFSGGMIPTFLVVKSMGLLDSVWSLILPTAISAFILIIIKNFFQQLPDGLEEAAKIDGCSDIRILFNIVLPLSLPAIATFSLFYAVGHWNAFFNAVLYINDHTKWPIQVWMRQIVILAQAGVGDSSAMAGEAVPQSQTIKMAIIVVSTLPIMLVYPFLQKHFAQGVLMGSVKG